MNLLEKSKAIRNQEITALDSLEKFNQVIASKNSNINAFVQINHENALEKANEIDARIKNGEKVGKLAGMIIGIKSNINVKDFTISAASKTLENYMGSYDATVIERIKEEDGIIIGMTNMDEFAAGSSTEKIGRAHV